VSVRTAASQAAQRRLPEAIVAQPCFCIYRKAHQHHTPVYLFLLVTMGCFLYGGQALHCWATGLPRRMQPSARDPGCVLKSLSLRIHVCICPSTELGSVASLPSLRVTKHQALANASTLLKCPCPLSPPLNLSCTSLWCNFSQMRFGWLAGWWLAVVLVPGARWLGQQIKSAPRPQPE
jgi:hypothetical protein